jgi:alkylhydroperoxidase family enzyme
VRQRHEIAEELGFGVVPNLFAAADPNPEVQTALWKAFRHTVLRGELPRTVKEMMGVVIAKTAGSPYAALIHLHALTFQGVEAPLLEALGRGEVPTGVPHKVALLLQFAREATRRPNDATLVEKLRETLSEAEVAEAVAVVGVFRMITCWTDLLAIPIDDL